jgi:hypothetical protein
VYVSSSSDSSFGSSSGPLSGPAAGASAAQGTLDLSPDVQSFFRGEVESALDEGGFRVTDPSVDYVSALLTDYLRPDPRTDAALRESLTLLFGAALESEGPERFERFRCLGDGVLYFSGFFGDNLKRRGVKLDYVGSLGARAYDGAANLLSGRAVARDVFRELASKFSTFVALVSNVANTIQARNARTDESVLRLYERWARGGSQRLADELLRRGVTPVRGPTGDN